MNFLIIVDLLRCSHCTDEPSDFICFQTVSPKTHIILQFSVSPLIPLNLCLILELAANNAWTKARASASVEGPTEATFMKIALVLLLFFSINSLASTHSVVEGYQINDLHFLPLLKDQPDLTIDHLVKGHFEVYGPRGLGTYLRRIHAIGAHQQKQTTPTTDYLTPEEVGSELQALAAAHPQTARLFSIGKSAQGRDLWVMKISRNVAKYDARPEFKYIANMHGDEIVGRELMVRLSRYLLEQDGKLANVSHLLDDVQIYIMPSMNPDGAAAQTRANGNGADLNRDFPNFNSGDQNVATGRQPETQAVMAWEATRHFKLSANFHGGAEVVNYPWDEMAALHPQDALVRSLSLEYAKNAPYIIASSEFQNGITNGFAWYEVDGGMQDWSDYWHNDLQLTIELSDVKWPSYDQIDNFECQNLKALLGLISRVRTLP